MNAYRVHYATGDTDYPQGLGSIHIAALTREEAVYKAFDELHDSGALVTSITEVYIEHEGRWLTTTQHTLMEV